MLSRREFGGGLAAGVAVHRRGPDRSAPPPPPNEPNLARILRTKKLRIAGLLAEEPYSYKDPATGQWNGVFVAMARNLAAELGVDIVVAESNWADLATDVHSSKIDLSFLTPTGQRGMFVDFANPVFYDTYAIVARKGFAPKGWSDLDTPETLVAVDTASPREEAARRFLGKAAITGFKTLDEATGAIQSGRADCLITTVLFALTVLKKNPQPGELILPTPYLRAAVCPGLPYDNDRRFRGVVDAWSEDNRGVGRIREWIVADLARFGIDAGELPSTVSFDRM
jgi:polar amino acid transport system substrate-binding protein